jgi:hypothetical protein
MSDVAILTPSRGRPAMAGELIDHVRRMSHLDARVYLGVDEDDPQRQDYVDLHRDGERTHTLFVERRKNLVQWTNDLAHTVMGAPVPPRYLASLGDDHRPRTPGWDRLLTEAIEARGGTGIAYGDDLYQGRRMATAWVVSADIVSALGWVMLPGLVHLFPDAAAMALADEAGCLLYCPEVKVEHLHPLAGKSQVGKALTDMDESYMDSNSRSRYASDGEVFTAWQQEAMAEDVAKVRKLLQANGGAW